MRRGIVLLGAMAAAASVPGLAASDSGALQQPTAFVAPSGPVTLTRVLRRDLSDGKAVVLTRSYRLDFVRHDGGYHVSAVAIEASVEAPPALSALAAIELERQDTAFALDLDAEGLIVDAQAADTLASRARLAARGEALIAAAVTPDRDRAQALGMFGQLLQSMGGSALPRDFFNPRSPNQREQRALALPDGSQGQIEIELQVERQAAGRLPHRYSRQVVTTLGGSRQTSREDFVLSPQ